MYHIMYRYCEEGVFHIKVATGSMCFICLHLIRAKIWPAAESLLPHNLLSSLFYTAKMLGGSKLLLLRSALPHLLPGGPGNLSSGESLPLPSAVWGTFSVQNVRANSLFLGLLLHGFLPVAGAGRKPVAAEIAGCRKTLWILAVPIILNRLPFFVPEVWQQCPQTARLKGCRLHKPWWQAQRKSFGLVST